MNLIILTITILCLFENSFAREDPTNHRFDFPPSFGARRPPFPNKHNPTNERFDSGIDRPRRHPGVLGSIVNNAKCKATEFSANLKLHDETFVRKQLDCVLNQGPCDKIGITVKRIAPEIMRGRCPPPCNSCMKKQIQKMMAIISRKYPREWSQIIKEQLG